MQIKLIACDLDGTLLNDKGEVSLENLEAITELKRRGVLFVPTSGRTYDELPQILVNNEDIRYYILSGGAALYDKLTGESFSNSLPKESLMAVLDLLKGRRSVVLAHIGKHCLFDFDNFESETRLGYLEELFRAVAQDVRGIEDYLYGRDDVDMAAVIFRDRDELSQVYSQIKYIDGISLAKNTLGKSLSNLEINSIGSEKGDGVSRLAKKLGIKESEVAVIGDSGNDYSMISRFENSFAVSNASKNIKDAANYIACSNNEHVLKWLLDNYVKGEAI